MTERRRVNESNRANRTFDDYIHDFGLIYQHTDADRDVTDVLLNVINHTSRVSEAVRRNQSAGILQELSEVVAWLLSLVSKRRDSASHPIDSVFFSASSMTQIIWAKYPAQCPACLERELERMSGVLRRPKRPTEAELAGAVSLLNESFPPGEPRPCTCLSCPGVGDRNQTDSPRVRRRKKLIRRRYASEHRDRARKQVGQVEETFRAIYAINVENQSLSDIAFHLQEEVGEVAEALVRTYTYGNKERKKAVYERRLEEVDEELADVFSWVYSLIFKIQETVRNVDAWWKATISEEAEELLNWRKISLPAIVWVRYGEKEPPGIDQRVNRYLRCGLCRNRVCDCDWFIARTPERISMIEDWR